MINPNGTQPTVMRCRTSAHLRWMLSIDESHNQGSPIRREGDLPQYIVNGAGIGDQRLMRQGKIMTVEEHLRRLDEQAAGGKILSFIGNGNLLANFHFVGWRAGKLFCLDEERVFEHIYTSAVFWKDGRVRVEEIFFVEEMGNVHVYRKLAAGTENITEAVDFLTSGQPLVRNGDKTSLGHISHLFYDTRHLVNPLCLRVNGATLFVPNSQLQHGLTRKALCEPIRVALEARVGGRTVLPLSVEGWLHMSHQPSEALGPVEAFLKEHEILTQGDTLSNLPALLHAAQTTDHLLRRALDEAGYEVVEELAPLKEGQACFINNHLEIFLKKAVYPHNIFVRWSDGSTGAVVYPGRSGRRGTTLTAAQDFLVGDLGVADALLLDNGGDARLWYRGQYMVPPSENRPEIRSLLALAAFNGGGRPGSVSIS